MAHRDPRCGRASTSSPRPRRPSPTYGRGSSVVNSCCRTARWRPIRSVSRRCRSAFDPLRWAPLGSLLAMASSHGVHRQRERADSFGAAARAYDQYRPRYPAQLIDDLVAPGIDTALDVGAGTGISSRQLANRGVDVLALEPDPRMAEVAAEKGIRTQLAKFEDWDDAGQTFDLVL